MIGRYLFLKQQPVAGFSTPLFLLLISLFAGSAVYAQASKDDKPETLGLDEGVLDLDTDPLQLKILKASQTVFSLAPEGEDGFDFTPGDRIKERNKDGFYHLGDLNLRLRTEEDGEWKDFSTAAKRAPVKALQVKGDVLAAADLASTLPADIPLQVKRFWELSDGQLTLRFELQNNTDQPVEIGSLGIPMIFNNNHQGKTLEEAHVENVFYDPYIGQQAGYLQVTRLHGQGPVLLVVPYGETSFEAYNPLLDDPTPRNITFEGFHEWLAHSKAHAEEEWKDAEQWNTPTSVQLSPGESRSYGVKFIVTDAIRNIEEQLITHERPVAVGIPGYVLPQDVNARLFLNYKSEVRSIEVEPQGALKVQEGDSTKNGWKTYEINGQDWGRARLTITYEDGLQQSVHYKVIKPEEQVVADHGNFLTTAQWFEDKNDPFDRHLSVISYDYEKMQQVKEDSRAWIPGLSDEAGAGSWLSAMMKQLIQPNAEELEKLQQFVHQTMWGGIQYSEGEHKYGVRKSMFFYAPDSMPEGTYSPDVDYSTWAAWNPEEAASPGRSYNYPHVAAAHWVLYQLARNRQGLVTEESWDWYLQNAYHTAMAMVEHAPHYAQFGQMEGTVFFLILLDLKSEGMTEMADALEETMRERADLWRSLEYPFGSEMPWDSTGQEEVYIWSLFFGYHEKADVTLNAILAYMPTVPHWGYNGSARRYWDFLYGGKLKRIERQLHHYGSGLNAIPVLTEFRNKPDDFYLLRVGHGGLMGSIANITQDGFGPAAFHSFPSTLDIDYYSGDYGSGFFGYAVNTGTYITEHDEFGWLSFGGNLETKGDWVEVDLTSGSRSRAYLAPLGLWLTLDAGRFKNVALNAATGEVRLVLDPADEHTPNAILRLQQPAAIEGVGNYSGNPSWKMERGAYIIPLEEGLVQVQLEQAK